MERKNRGLVILLGVLILLVLILGPLAPLWQELGIEPVCIQGDWPHLKIGSCDGQTAPVEPVSFDIPDSPLPLIVDDDGSPDGMIALLYFLKNPVFEVKAVTISYGEAHPRVFAPQVANLLADLGESDIPIGYGADEPLEGANAFPEGWREASDAFWDIPAPESAQAITPVPAVQLIIDTLEQSKEPVTIFLSGAHTNLAAALRAKPEIKERIHAVYIMGGSVYSPGNIHSADPTYENEVAEWNIWVDPLAAAEVLASGLELHLMPLDGTQDVPWTSSDRRVFLGSGSPEGKKAADLFDVMTGRTRGRQVFIWDLLTAVQATAAQGCAEERLGLRVNTEPGPAQGQTVITSEEQNISVCLDAVPETMKGIVLSVFQRP